MWPLLSAYLLLTSGPTIDEVRPQPPRPCAGAADETYFPRGVFDVLIPRAGAADARWPGRVTEQSYSTFLSAMGEPSLLCGNVAGETYRFVWLRSKRPPIAVRLEVSGDRMEVVGLGLESVQGTAPNERPVTRVSRELRRSEWKAISRKLDAANFWGLAPSDMNFGFDGADWLLEGRRGAQYHVVSRWSPDSGAFREVCLQMAKVAGVLPPSRKDIF
jgi:hypothetical protein